ncbi:MAG TPA: hypothetical protein IAA98_11420 [Candidatus Avipropionibacterium avicola]|uniref:Fenitrothion hydrolase n=1 Tax=Candidatus Avipropionibacterium avicola TaxID=2840701 RepID=A0A9D1KNU9_9ACTN|nr:hypothetical protein [Candidatus Avipropionibacterium avicola]
MTPIPMHGIASRQDLPLPFEYVVAGAIIALLVSFVLMFFGWPQRRYRERTGRRLGRVPTPVVWLGRIVVLAIYALAALALIGGEDRLTNPIFGFVFAVVWVGLVPLSALFGPVWSVLNPIRTIHRGLSALLRVKPEEGLFALPARLGVWPATLGLFAFAFFELVQPGRTTLPVMRLYVAVWFVVLIVGAVLFGSRWIAAADPFEAYASTVAAGAPLQPTKDGAVQLMSPLAALSTWKPPPGTAGVVCVLLGSTAFDSFANTSWWVRRIQDSTLPYEIWGTGGLVVLTLIVAVSFVAACVAMAPVSRKGVTLAALPRLMAPSVAPILVGYAVAHYLTLLIIEGQRTFINLSDPLGLGWNLFGTAELGVNTAMVMNPVPIAIMQAVAIVGGHIVGIVIAHERSLAILRSDRTVRGQVPMLAVMVCYTIAGLLLLFSP